MGFEFMSLVLLTRSVKDGIAASWVIIKIMIPVLAVVKLLELTGVDAVLGRILGPVMASIGLPEATGLVFSAALLTGVYGALSALAAVSDQIALTSAQATVLAALLLIAHGLPVEARVAQKAGVSLAFTVAWRIGIGFLFAGMLHAVFSITGILQRPASMALASVIAPGDDALGPWVTAQAIGLAKMTVIIVALVTLLNILKALHIERLLQGIMAPVLRLVGIDRRATGITVVGILLGISYGGGLIIREAKSGTLDFRAVASTLALLALLHSVIEDTALMLLTGANLWAILAGRVAVSLIAVAAFSALTARMPEARLRRIFASRSAAPA